MAWKNSGKPPLHRSPAFLFGAVAVLILSSVILGPRGKRRFDRWSAARQVERAAEFLAKGDVEHAALGARSVLQADPLNVAAARVMARSLEAIHVPGAMLWRQRVDALGGGDAENTLGWAKDALAAGDAATASEVLQKLKPADQTGAAYHDLMARIAVGKRDTAGAESHWSEAAKLEPKEERYRLNLAVLQAQTGKAATREGALEVLTELSTTSDKRLPALRTLLGDALSHRDGEKSKELAKTLASDPQAIFADKLARLKTLRALEDPEATANLLELRDGAVSKPAELASLLAWMNDNGLAMMVSEWVKDLPPEMIAKPPVAISVAGARARNSEWEKIEDALFSATWGEADHLRQAYRARALDHLSEEDKAKAADAWKAALIAAGKRAGALEALAKLAASWGWDRRGEEALWKLSAIEQCPRWVREQLWGIVLKRRDTQQLHTVARLMVKADPRSIISRNDSIFLSLLLRTTETALREQAEALHKEVPENPNVAATFGLSLFQRGRAEEAVALMEKYPADQLRDPSAARYLGVFLSATERRAEAEKFLKLGESGFLLPEESALIAQARAAAAAK